MLRRRKGHRSLAGTGLGGFRSDEAVTIVARAPNPTLTAGEHVCSYVASYFLIPFLSLVTSANVYNTPLLTLRATKYTHFFLPLFSVPVNQPCETTIAISKPCVRCMMQPAGQSYCMIARQRDMPKSRTPPDYSRSRTSTRTPNLPVPSSSEAAKLCEQNSAGKI